jgi:AraC family transcriptional regulator of adaptative response / DNA-3-methyladenine glycosylase II
MQIQSDTQNFQRARKSRDARFDGLFFIAVKTTGIYCRPICPANSPLEKNVEYHDSAISAAQAGYRPCLRCRPDAAPNSCAWLGTQTSFRRAMDLINQGALQSGSIEQLAQRLGITDRYLRELFQNNLGTSPKKYAIYQQCLFAKQLLHESTLAITDIAYASGFNSVRRFNEAMRQQIGLSPRDIRKSDPSVSGKLRLKLHYRPPYAWAHVLNFLSSRLIEGLEWVEHETYFRTISHEGTSGFFSVENSQEEHCLMLDLHLDDYAQMNPITQKVRALFDVDAPISAIDAQLQPMLGMGNDGQPLKYLQGLRIPGIWDSFEAGVRAILGQQVSVTQARRLVTTLVNELGEDIKLSDQRSARLFPTAEEVRQHSLDFLRMPQSRKDTIVRLAEHFCSDSDPHNIDNWLTIKGVGPWTVNYVKIRAGKDPDVWLAGDAGVNNALKIMTDIPDLEAARPWRSYLTFQLWNQL